MSDEKVRSRGWCFTVNNWSDDDVYDITAMYDGDLNCRYLVIGFECGRNGTEHLQCYIYYENQVTWNSFKEKLPGKWHFESQKADKNVHAYTYCMKEYTFMEFGDAPQQGNRSDLEYIKHDLLLKRPMKDISKNYFSQWCQYRRSFDEFKFLHDLNDKYDTQIYLFDKDMPKQQIQLIYQDLQFDPQKDKLYGNEAYFHSSLDFAKEYFSKKYRRLFLPNNNAVIEMVRDYHHEFLY